MTYSSKAITAQRQPAINLIMYLNNSQHPPTFSFDFEVCDIEYNKYFPTIVTFDKTSGNIQVIDRLFRQSYDQVII